MLGRIILALDHAGLIAAGTATGSIVVMIMSGIIMRTLGKPLLFADEYSGYLMAVVVFLALPAVTRERSHICAEFPANLASPRMQLVLRMLADAILFVYTALLFWLATRMTIESFIAGIRSQGLMSTPILSRRAQWCWGWAP